MPIEPHPTDPGLVVMRAGQYNLDAAPPKREWVGLTDKEIREVNAQVSRIPPIDYTTSTYARAIEAKLKEKNSGQ